MITDLFSHKIHSSGNDWPDKLVELACLFAEFDGHLYDRDALEQRLQRISPRSAYAWRDSSKLRDEIGAYPAYLGMYRLESSPQGWIVRLASTARAYLASEEPNVGAFLRLQLCLFQYPNGMGAHYYPGTNRARIQANARNRTLDMVSKGVHLSPLRMICKALAADAEIRDVDQFRAVVTYSEIYTLVNAPEVNTRANPPLERVTACLRNARSGLINPPLSFECRFHILRHTELFEVVRGVIRFRQPINETDEKDMRSKIEVLLALDDQFEGFDGVITSGDLIQVIADGKWGTYFDGVRTLPAGVAQVLGTDLIDAVSAAEPAAPVYVVSVPKAYPLKERDPEPTASPPTAKKKEMADPEITKIKRQRRNLIHKRLVEQMDQLVRGKHAAPYESQHIDLFAEIPDDGSFLFEMKSGGDKLLDQIRKGISQLYEYRFRYSSSLESDVTLCLVVGTQPAQPDWLIDYVCVDRDICLCWFGESGALESPDQCADRLVPLHA